MDLGRTFFQILRCLYHLKNTYLVVMNFFQTRTIFILLKQIIFLNLVGILKLMFGCIVFEIGIKLNELKIIVLNNIFSLDTYLLYLV